eukprot:jgi/Phyca11/107760/e_gw1.14.764.1
MSIQPILASNRVCSSYRYSLQLCIKFKKYYKSLFLGLVDLAIINAYIVHNAARAAANLPNVNHVTFLKKLHMELCQLREEDWDSLRSNECFQATPSRSGSDTGRRQPAHRPQLNDEWRVGNNNKGRKRRTRACKVCSILKGTDGARGGASSVYCSKCKLPNSSKKPLAWRVFLCEKARHVVNGKAMSCFDIWHSAWRNGTLAPAPSGAKKRTIRARAPAKKHSSEESAGEGVQGDGEEGAEASNEPSDESDTSPSGSKRPRLAAASVMTA